MRLSTTILPMTMPNAVPHSTFHYRNTTMNTQDLNAMSFDQLVPSKSRYLTKDDVGTSGLILTIALFKSEVIESDDGSEEKIVLHFAEDVKPMVLNRTNSALLAGATQAKTVGEARGKTIVVYNDPTIMFAGKVTGGLRIRSHSEEKPKPAPARPPQPAGISAGRTHDPDDGIPF
jgi:hypothetical protein